MGRNVEIKARAHDLKAQQLLTEARATEPTVRFSQHDTFYNVPTGRLKLRRFADGTGELIQYDRDDQPEAKSSRYVISPTDDPDSLDRALANAIGTRGTVEKWRTLVMVGQTRVHFDVVEGLGDYIELEVVLTSSQSDLLGREIAQELTEYLGIKSEDLVSKAYIDLLESAAT